MGVGDRGRNLRGERERVSGVVVGPEDLEIHIVATTTLPRPIPEIAENIRSA